MDHELLKQSAMTSSSLPKPADRDAARARRDEPRAPREHSLTSSVGTTARVAHRATCFAVVVASLLTACAGGEEIGRPAFDDAVTADEPETEIVATTPPPSETQARVDEEPAAADDEPQAPVVTPDALLAKLTSCTNKVSTAPYARDKNAVENVDVCGLNGAVFFKADMDIVCDGKETPQCNKTTDPWFLPMTATTDSKGEYLDAAALPFIVLPMASARWNYKNSDLLLGSVAAVIYKGKVQYGIVGDIGPAGIIGEASYAMAVELGINPDPKIGGTSQEVTYIVFTGASARVKKKEDHAEAVAIGQQRAAQFLVDN